MSEILKHLINGRWETGVTMGVSENPSDLDDVVAEYARAAPGAAVVPTTREEIYQPEIGTQLRRAAGQARGHEPHPARRPGPLGEAHVHR